MTELMLTKNTSPINFPPLVWDCILDFSDLRVKIAVRALNWNAWQAVNRSIDLFRYKSEPDKMCNLNDLIKHGEVDAVYIPIFLKIFFTLSIARKRLLTLYFEPFRYKTLYNAHGFRMDKYTYSCHMMVDLLPEDHRGCTWFEIFFSDENGIHRQLDDIRSIIHRSEPVDPTLLLALMEKKLSFLLKPFFLWFSSLVFFGLVGGGLYGLHCVTDNSFACFCFIISFVSLAIWTHARVVRENKINDYLAVQDKTFKAAFLHPTREKHAAYTPLFFNFFKTPFNYPCLPHPTERKCSWLASLYRFIPCGHNRTEISPGEEPFLNLTSPA